MHPIPFRTTRSRRPTRAGAAAFLAAVVAATTLWATAMPASAATTPLVGAGSQRCLDVTGNVDTPGTALELWDCNGQSNQAFEFTAAGELRTLGGTRCVDAYDNQTAPGTPVIIWTCNGQTNQQWRHNADGSITGVQSGLCLDADHQGTANGTPIILWTCNGQSNQRWTSTGGGTDGNTMVVDVGTVVRPVTHVGSGTLYGLADASTPPVSVMQPLHLNQIRQPPPGTQHRPNGWPVPVGDALVVAPNAMAVGATMTIDMADSFPGFPYDWAGWSDWLGRVDRMIAAVQARPDITNINAWEPWNEPDWTWPSSAGSFTDGWTRTYHEIRQHDPSTDILGPSISSWNVDWMRSFLTAAKAANTLPDVISWHELSGWQQVTDDVRAYRALERQLGISPRPISIDEYATTSEIDVPSSVNHYIAQFERAGVRDAERAFWYEPGTLNGLLYDNQPTASYWMYKWYGDQSGDVVGLTPTAYNDGVASYDSSSRVVTIVFGGQSGDNNVRIDGIGQLGSGAHVTLNYVSGTGRTTVVSAPTMLWSRTYPISGGSITVPIPNEDPFGAYELVVTPG